MQSRNVVMWWAVFAILPVALASWCPADCRCDRSSLGDLELECPAGQEEAARLMVKVKPSVSARFQCTSATSPEDFALLDGLQTGPAPSVSFLQCPLPPLSLLNLTQSIGIISVTDLLFQSFTNLTDQLVSSHFQGLTNLSRLKLTSNGFTEVPIDLLRDLQNLTTLDLRDNFIRIPTSFFANVPNLTTLELGNNRLTVLEPGLFEKLSKLKLLNLWSNKLSYLNGTEFDKLKKLESLDLHSNNLVTLPVGIFHDLVNLKNLNLFGNNFSALPLGVFNLTPRLENLRLYNNQQNLTLTGNLLGGLKNLKEVFLMRNGIKSVPPDLFVGSSAIANLSLSGNLLVDLPVGLLADQTNLKLLDLSYNKLQQLPDGFFQSLSRLETLRLGFNSLTKISKGLFMGLANLRSLNLENNKLVVIHSSAFVHLPRLRQAHLSHNKLSLLNSDGFPQGGLQYRDEFGSQSPFNPCIELEYLYLSNNSISEIFQDWRLVLNKLRLLDLTYNVVDHLQTADLQFLSRNVSVDLRHNLIREVDLGHFWAAENSPTNRGVPRVLLASNPLICDCMAYNLMKYAMYSMAPAVYGIVRLEMEGLRCEVPSALANRPFLELSPHDLTCTLSQRQGCIAPCECSYRSVDKGLIVNCSRRHLTEIPERMPLVPGSNHTELILEDNWLTFLPNSTPPGYEKVTHLFLSGNQLTNLDPALLGSHLEVLTADHNNLSHVTNATLEKLNNATNLRLVTLNSNPWDCDCEARELLSWLQRRFKQVSFLGNVTCKDGRILSKMSAGELCPAQAALGLILFCVGIAAMGVLVGITAALYYRYHYGVRVWMYAHRCCLWLVTEEELDRDMKYDAFVSFSQKDENFVVQELVPRLEGSGLKLCLHYRDWVAGEWIPNQIANSVESSRRTLVVLSPNFLDSVWGRLEFRAAHKQALSEGRARVVMLLYGDLPSTDQLDPELRAYISVNTYVKWGDPWFWDKLRYALPHAPLPSKKSKKSDRLELIMPPESPTMIPTTPPGLNGATPSLFPLTVLQSPNAVCC